MSYNRYVVAKKQYLSRRIQTGGDPCELDDFTLGARKGKYRGECAESVPNGAGTFVTGTREYTGTWKDGQIVGEGELKITLKSGQHVYRGTFDEHNQLRGKIVYASGGSFEGEFQNGAIHDGTLTMTGGVISKGIFEDNKLVRGTQTLQDGTVYEGKFRDNKFAKGKIRKPDGSEIEGTADQWGRMFKGKFANYTTKFRFRDEEIPARMWGDNTESRGLYSAKVEGVGLRFEGTVYGEPSFGLDPRQGEFTMVFKGDNYRGKIWDDIEVRYANGDSFTGSMRDGFFPANGTYVYADGSRYVGSFNLKSQYDGMGVLTTKEGNVYDGFWKDGKKNGIFQVTIGGVATEKEWLDDVPNDNPCTMLGKPHVLHLIKASPKQLGAESVPERKFELFGEFHLPNANYTREWMERSKIIPVTNYLLEQAARGRQIDFYLEVDMDTLPIKMFKAPQEGGAAQKSYNYMLSYIRNHAGSEEFKKHMRVHYFDFRHAKWLGRVFRTGWSGNVEIDEQELEDPVDREFVRRLLLGEDVVNDLYVRKGRNEEFKKFLTIVLMLVQKRLRKTYLPKEIYERLAKHASTLDFGLYIPFTDYITILRMFTKFERKPTDVADINPFQRDIVYYGGSVHTENVYNMLRMVYSEFAEYRMLGKHINTDKSKFDPRDAADMARLEREASELMVQGIGIDGKGEFVERCYKPYNIDPSQELEQIHDRDITNYTDREKVLTPYDTDA